MSARSHAVNLQATFWPGGRVPADGHLALWGGDDLVRRAEELGFPPGEPAELPTVLPASPRARKNVAATDVPAHVVPIRTAARVLATIDPPDAWPAWSRPSDSVLAWSVAAKLALEQVAAGHLVPVLRPAGEDQAITYWRLVGAGDGRLAGLARVMPPAAHALRRDEDDQTIWTAVDLLAAFGDAVADACARTLDGTPAVPRRRSFEHRWVAALTGTDPLVDPVDEDLLPELAGWAVPLLRREAEATARLCVQLHAPVEESEPWDLAYHLQAADDPSLLVPADDVWASGTTKLPVLGRQVSDPQESLARGLAEAARLFPPIDASLSEQRPAALELNTEAAAAFLTQGAAELTAAGLGVLLPAELTTRGARKLRARMRIGDTLTDPGAGLTGAGMTAEKLGRFRWEAAIGDDPLTAEEFAQIVALKQPLVRWKGEWVRLDSGEVPRLAELVGTEGELSGVEALTLGLAGQRETTEFGEVEVVANGVLAELIERLRGADVGREPELAGVAATLRDYQRRGVAWLQTMCSLGFGALLADDMGLGKTLQTIALLAHRGADRPHLVVCPTSVVGNWDRELTKFAPDLPVIRHHGGLRASEAEEFKAGAVVVTSYGLLRRDFDLLRTVDWDVVVLDEAQQIKNPAAKAAKAARALPAQARVALTGTPVENRLSELWSIMEFANPGMLGPFTRFIDSYATPIERFRDHERAARLRRVTGPFLMRRLKTEVATDLPAKQESIVACTLTREQATLYRAVLAEILDDPDGGGSRGSGRGRGGRGTKSGRGKKAGGLGSGIERRGRILKLLTALKQICNHPAQYLGESGPTAGRSGKLARATEMLAEVVAADEHALIFTQYREMGMLLAEHLSASLHLPDVPFLHGGVSRKRRDQMIDDFQSGQGSPLLIVSLKAGGTGLNLTRATHVLHFDRWWNPAVEDQATDRAYRIGQTRGVNVYKLVTGGTLEERIADLLEQKRALADSVVGTGETWLTELDDDELRALVQLSSDDLTGVEPSDEVDDVEEVA
jgi:superfamily II DNA or RNA helicase